MPSGYRERKHFSKRNACFRLIIVVFVLTVIFFVLYTFNIQSEIFMKPLESPHSPTSRTSIAPQVRPSEKPHGQLLAKTPPLGPVPMTATAQVTRLLHLLETFVESHIGNVSIPSDRIEQTASSPPYPHTPDWVVNEYYGSELIHKSNAYEKMIDEDYAPKVVHSKSYFNPFHVSRRGYGTGGSIFVGLVHDEPVNYAQGNPETGSCAATVYRLYEEARWPIGVFTGIVQVIVAPDNTSLPVPSCIPKEYRSKLSIESYSFTPMDNIRVRQIRAGTTMKKADLREKHRYPFLSIAAQRYAVLTLYRGETYIMFLTAGVSVVPQWDIMARLLFLQAPSPRAVLSQVPAKVDAALVRRVWTEVVVSGVTMMLKSIRNDTTTGGSSLPRANMSTESFKWALDPVAAELDARATAATRETLGLTTDDVLQYLAAPERVRYHEGTTTKEVPFRNDIQMYWVVYYGDDIRRKLGAAMKEHSFATHVCGVHGINKKELSESNDPLSVRLIWRTTKRMSHAMTDERYMNPSPFRACIDDSAAKQCPAIDFAEVPPKRWKEDHHGNVYNLPFLLQPIITTEFLFTRAEAFFPEYKKDDTAVQMDPYLSHVTPEEESVLLSARLWTSGWDFFAPTEPIVFLGSTSGDSSTKGGESATVKMDEATMSKRALHMRQASVGRLRHILFGEAADKKYEKVAMKDVNYLGLGKMRSTDDFMRFSGVEKNEEKKDFWCDSIG